MSFANKVILITGASSGIGAACAEYFAEEGAKLALVGRNVEKFDKVVAKIKEIGVTDEPLVILADVSTDAKRIIDETIKKYQQLDILINNAGFGKLGSIETLGLDTYDAVMNTNVRAVVELTQLAVPHLTQTKGNIINVSSVAGFRAIAGFLAYCMSKAALDQFTKCIALELAPKGIRVNSVNPGLVITDFQAKLDLTPVQWEDFIVNAKKKYPIGRIGEVEDIVNAITCLANEKASFVTGVCFPVDGGLLLSVPQ